MSFVIAGMLPPQGAAACSVPIPAPLDRFVAALEGDLDSSDEWAWLGEVTGLVEYQVVRTWDASGDFTAASASMPVRVWGNARVPATATIRGGENVGPAATTSSCPPSRAWALDTMNYEAVTEGRYVNPLDGDALTAAQEAVLLAHFGDPEVLRALPLPDTHPTAGPAASRQLREPQDSSGVVFPLVALSAVIVAAGVAGTTLVRRRGRHA